MGIVIGAGKTAWVTGSAGFIGGAMMWGLDQAGYKVVGTDAELSVTEPERLEAFAEEVQPDIIVNCAGIRRDATTLDTKAKAYEVNALGALNMAIVANTVGATIVQVSSDDVYGTKLDEPVNEFDQPRPTTPYGKSKMAGETMVRSTTSDHLILRSSWLYQANRGHFKEVMDAAIAGERIESRTDQFAAPTSVGFYMYYLLKMLERGAKGTYHITPRGKASRYDLNCKILEFAGYDPSKVLIPTTDPETEEDIVLESMMLEIAGANLPSWDYSLRKYMSSRGLLAE